MYVRSCEYTYVYVRMYACKQAILEDMCVHTYSII